MKLLSIHLLKKLEWGSALACRLTQLTGKAAAPTHPKHLADFGQWYYLKYLRPHDRVLDLGCHAGEHTFKAAAKTFRVIGIDLDQRLLTQAKNQARRLKLHNVSFHRFNLEAKLPYPNRSFDKVFLFAVLEHLYHRHQLLQEIRRVLVPGGILFISVPNQDTWWKKLQRSVELTGFIDADHKVEFSRRGITKLLAQHKFLKLQFDLSAIDTPLAGMCDLIGGISLSLYRRIMAYRVKLAQASPNDMVGFLITAHTS